MGRPSRISDAVIVAVYCSAWLGALALAAPLSRADDDAGRVKGLISVAQDTTDTQSPSAGEMQNIQRLLKLLSDRYPKTYGPVDPKRVDGRLGPETQEAIRRYKQISGSRADLRNGEKLVADILSTLAQMSATQAPETPSEKPSVSDAQPAADASPAAKGTETPRPTPSPATSVETTGPKRDATTRSEMGRILMLADRAAPANQRVYFVQVASLRSIESAEREWQQIFERNRAALRGEQIFFEKVDIPDKGTFHRILVGPIYEREAAQTLCTFLKKNDQRCVVTSRRLGDLKKNEDRSSAPDLQPRQPAGGDGKRQTKDEAVPPTAAPPLGDDARRSSQVASALRVPLNEPPAGTEGSAAAIEAPATRGLNQPAASPAQRKENPDRKSAPEAGQADVTPDSVKAKPSPTVIAEKGPADKTAAFDRSETVAALASPATSSPMSGVPPAGNRPAPKSDFGDFHARVAGDTGLPTTQQSNRTTREAPGTAATAVSRLVDSAAAMSRTMATAAAIVIGAALLLMVWRRQTQKATFARLHMPANLPFGRSAARAKDPLGALEELETDFESEALKESRSVRDEFLLDVLGDQVDDDNLRPKEDSALRVNNSLKSLLASDPGQYKSIFLNLIFLSKVGAALNRKEINLEDLNGPFGREFNLLQNYFKIHVLELDDRHHIRRELPGLFYCLQLAQQRQRPSPAVERPAAP